MKHSLRIVAAVAVLVALVLCVPVEAQTPEIEALRARAEQGDAEAQFKLGAMYDFGRSGLLQDDAEAARWYRLAAGVALLMVLNFHFASGVMFQWGYLANFTDWQMTGTALSMSRSSDSIVRGADPTAGRQRGAMRETLDLKLPLI